MSLTRWHLGAPGLRPPGRAACGPSLPEHGPRARRSCPRPTGTEGEAPQSSRNLGRVPASGDTGNLRLCNCLTRKSENPPIFRPLRWLRTEPGPISGELCRPKGVPA
ncbi:uncharacterized protein AAEQ78_001616 [Lycaon pictus]